VVAVIDPVEHARGAMPRVPDNVQYFWNYYASKAIDAVRIAVVNHAPHGEFVQSDAAVSEQRDLAPTGPTRYEINGINQEIDHWNIVDYVRDHTGLLGLMYYGSPT
jgi:hypothetical protein